MSRAERARPGEGAAEGRNPPLDDEGERDRGPPGAPGSRHGLGRIEGERPGPLVAVFAGMHGNEPAGVRALERVIAQVTADRIPVHGTLVGILGNVAACELGVRYVDFDLNRLWTPARVDRMRAMTREECLFVEELELWELVREVDRLIEGAPAQPSPVFIDLHTASASSAPFAISRNTLDHISLLRGLPIPILAGLEESLEGLLLKHIIERGGRTVAVETGPHQGQNAAEELEAALWILFATAGTIASESIPGGRAGRDSLRELCRGIPPIVEVVHRHEVTDRSEFRMEEGFRSFDLVSKGRLLAIDHGKQVRAPRRGRVLMPLYQERGEDGFFLGLDRDRLYLTLSRWFRRLHLEWLLSLFPSVRRERELGDAWRVDRSDREWVREALRFFGYREQVRLKGGTILAWRRRR